MERISVLYTLKQMEGWNDINQSFLSPCERSVNEGIYASCMGFTGQMYSFVHSLHVMGSCILIHYNMLSYYCSICNFSKHFRLKQCLCNATFSFVLVLNGRREKEVGIATSIHDHVMVPECRTPLNSYLHCSPNL